MVNWTYTDFSNVTSVPTTSPQDVLYDLEALKWLRVLFFAMISIVGTIGNSLVILAYRNPRMRSVTNLFIANLGVADLTVSLLNVPVQVTYATLQYWPFGVVLCKTVPFIQGVTLFSSVGTLMAIAADRYRAIVHPLLPRIRTRHAIMIIAAIWTVALICPIPLIIYHKYQPSDRICDEHWPNDKDREIFTVIVFVVLYLIPLMVISVLYFLICHNLNTSESAAQAGANHAKKSVIRMLVIVVVLFTVCWAPYHATVLYLNFRDTKSKPAIWLLQLHMFNMWLMYVNSCCNPFVYAVLNRNYRREFGRLLRCQSLSDMMQRNPESTYDRDRRTSSDTRSFLKNASSYVDRKYFKRKHKANRDFSLENGTKPVLSNTSRITGNYQSDGNGKGVDKPLVCIESHL